MTSKGIVLAPLAQRGDVNPNDPSGVNQSRRPSYSVLLIDQERLTRECIADVLRKLASYLSVMTAETPSELPADRPDVVLFNIKSSRLDDPAVRTGLEALRQGYVDPPIIIISSHQDSRLAVEALRLRLRGWFPASLSPEVLIAAIGLVLAGGAFIPEGVIAHVAAEVQPTIGKRDQEKALGLTVRETDVMRLLRQGKPNKMIAFELDMSESTVKVHVRSIMKKLNARNRTQLAVLVQEPPVAAPAPMP